MNAAGGCDPELVGPENCAEFNSNEVCDLCNEGYELKSDGLCYEIPDPIVIPDNCIDFNEGDGQCELCAAGYVLEFDSADFVIGCKMPETCS